MITDKCFIKFTNHFWRHIYVVTTGVPTISTSFPSTIDKLSSLAAMDKPPQILYVEVLIGETAQLPCKIINPQGNFEIKNYNYSFK